CFGIDLQLHRSRERLSFTVPAGGGEPAVQRGCCQPASFFHRLPSRRGFGGWFYLWRGSDLPALARRGGYGLWRRQIDGDGGRFSWHETDRVDNFRRIAGRIIVRACNCIRSLAQAHASIYETAG